ncbi:uncharacterized protein LOC62_05G007305 [Vanrija pseudolonga]|uniref:Uncharacterized protein n=1 Tax=Vanrija pseudolonga TaxID=143232 RepID=A0AAF0YC73_9TREE|nr:hypothetical protein LOC62_05G007305 [Vanrija pseudolonga]
MEWISERVPGVEREDGDGQTWLQWSDFTPLLIRHPVPAGEPLLTIVNGGAIPKRYGMPGSLSTAAIEAQLKAAFNAECDARDAAVAGDEKYLDTWDPATRAKEDHVRAMTMDEWLAEHNGDAFDEGELAGVRMVYHTVKIGHGLLAAPPLSTNTDAACYVHILDIGPTHWIDCEYLLKRQPSYPPPLPSLRTVRMDSGFCHSFQKGADRRNHAIVDSLRPRTLVLRGCMEGEHTFYSITAHEDLVFPPVLEAVDEVICVFDTGTQPSKWLNSVRTNKFRFSRPVKFTFVFWTKHRGDLWIPAHGDLAGKYGLAIRLAFAVLLINQPIPEGGGPLFTIVNAGAIPSCFAIPDGTTTLASDELTVEERAVKFQAHLTAELNSVCDGRDEGHSFRGYGGRSKWDPATRKKQHSMRFLSMDDFLAQDDGNTFDPDELSGWTS